VIEWSYFECIAYKKTDGIYPIRQVFLRAEERVVKPNCRLVDVWFRLISPTPGFCSPGPSSKLYYRFDEHLPFW